MASLQTERERLRRRWVLKAGLLGAIAVAEEEAAEQESQRQRRRDEHVYYKSMAKKQKTAVPIPAPPQALNKCEDDTIWK